MWQASDSDFVMAEMVRSGIHMIVDHLEKWEVI